MSTTYTPTTARELASALDSDPIAASQIKEYLSKERLIELLGLEPILSDQALIDLIRKRKLVDACL